MDVTKNAAKLERQINAAKLERQINEAAVYWLIVNLSICYEQNLR
jgi:hypothetical protein